MNSTRNVVLSATEIGSVNATFLVGDKQIGPRVCYANWQHAMASMDVLLAFADHVQVVTVEMAGE